MSKTGNARCRFCGDIMGWATGVEFDEGVCVDCMPDVASPAVLRTVAMWLLDPGNRPAAVAMSAVVVDGPVMLQRLADALEGVEEDDDELA